MTLDQLSTPAAVVDLDRVERNCHVMRDRAHREGRRLRPHVKTHKVPALARLQLGGDGPITVSTLAEAKAFRAAGFDDITWAFPLPHTRAREALELDVQLVVDHLATVELLRGSGARVFLKVDCGYGRAGLVPEDPALVALAEAVVDAGLELRGVLTHAGHSYDLRDGEGLVELAEVEARALTRAANALGGCAERSAGSTPTCSVDADRGDVTELRPGNYVFYDRTQVAIGSCTEADCALEVLASVIAVYSDRAIVDAGGLALSKDAGPGDHYGALHDLDGQPLGCVLRSLSQEHGVVSGAGLRVGQRVRVQVNHSCMVAAAHDVLHGHRAGRLEDRFTPARGW
ncbi:MAG: DSD1 family PLP-dependent enzyme [Proteobacteria bacterium]|nr:DSD1 family PLP-dependent enzyme [Pseudomonadota bacterium]MCP4920400.1 DSD1 family PLP-dependent enzyme [Pseudomonadota bacterium]